MKTEYILRKEVDLILAALTPENRLVMRVALHTGLRISNILCLRPGQLKFLFWVTEQKTGKRRQAGLPEPLLSDLKRQAGKCWVFASPVDPHKHRTRQAVWKDVKQAAKLFRSPQNIAPHSARKVYAVELMEKYGDIAVVRRAPNHSSDAVTLIYALADQQLQAKYSRRRWEKRPRESVAHG